MQPPPSSTPPPPGYGYPAPPRRSGLPIWAWLLIGCVPVTIIFVAILAAILFPVLAKARENARQVSCESNERQMSLTILQYAQDSDEKLPDAATWMDATASYRGGNDQTLHCPDAWAQDPTKYGYAYDSGLGSKSMTEIPSPPTTLMLYDSTSLSRNATDEGTSLPEPGRHEDGNNTASLDGHVKWTKAGDTSSP